MLQDIRNNFQGTFAKIVIAIICIPFVLFGVESLFGGGAGNKVAEIDGEVITSQDLNQAIFLRKKQLIAQMGDQLDPSMLDDNRLANAALESLIDRKVNVLSALEQGFAISDQQINYVISQSADFQEDGQFSQQRFNQMLAASGLSSIAFKQLYYSELLLNQLASGVVNSAFLTAADVANNAVFMHEKRDIRFMRLALAERIDNIQLSDEDINNYYQANSLDFQSEEQVKLEYIRLQQADFYLTASEDEIQQAYQDEVDNLALQPSKEVAHILIDPALYDNAQLKDAKIAEVQAAIDAGEAFADIAERLSDDFGSKAMGGQLGTLAADIFPAEFVMAAEQLELNQVSAPVITDSGVHFIQITAVNEPDIPSLEERRAAIAENLAAANAEPAFWAAVEELKDISFNAPDLAEPAAALNVAVQQSGWFSRTTEDALLANPLLQNQAFSAELINDGVNSDIIELSPDEVMVIRVVEHKPAAVEPLTNVYEKVKNRLAREQAASSLSEQAQALVEQAKAGDSVEQIAKAQGLDWELALAAKRTEQTVPAQLLQQAFSIGQIPEGQRFIDSLELSNGDQIIFSVANTVAGAIADIPELEQSMIANYLAQSKGMLEFQAMRKQAKDDASIDIYLK
ncbi:MAG: SurA N-terminal domain-containing protein [Pseudomonadales bacterium]|nr:SurA N-terminal domain-containing protein [Pseudomonadales bacterium]